MDLNHEERMVSSMDGETIPLTPMPVEEVKLGGGGGAMTMNFFEALRKIQQGKMVARIEWANKDYCLMKDGRLTIFTNNKFFGWLINDGDMEGNDWVVVTEVN